MRQLCSSRARLSRVFLWPDPAWLLGLALATLLGSGGYACAAVARPRVWRLLAAACMDAPHAPGVPAPSFFGKSNPKQADMLH